MNTYRKIMVLSIFGLCIGSWILPTITGSNLEMTKKYDMSLSPILDCYYVNNLLNEDDSHKYRTNGNDGNVIFSDNTDDIWFITSGLPTRYGITGNKSHIDITGGYYSKIGDTVSVTMNVTGEIINREDVEYEISLGTLYNDSFRISYKIIYANNSCRLEIPYEMNLSDYTISNGSLSFSLTIDEEYEEKIDDIFIINWQNKFFSQTKNTSADSYWDVAVSSIDPLIIKIVSPENGIYINNEKAFPLHVPLILGWIEIHVGSITDNQWIARTELYINDELIQTSPFYSSGEYIRLTESYYGKYTLKILAYDTFGNRASDEIEVWKFF